MNFIVALFVVDYNRNEVTQMSIQFTDNSDKIKALFESAIAEGLRETASVMQTQANIGNKAGYTAHVDSDSVTISSSKPEAIQDEFGKGEWATGEKGSVAPKRSLTRAAIGNKNNIAKIFAEKLKDKLGG